MKSNATASLDRSQTSTIPQLPELGLASRSLKLGRFSELLSQLCGRGQGPPTPRLTQQEQSADESMFLPRPCGAAERPEERQDPLETEQTPFEGHAEVPEGSVSAFEPLARLLAQPCGPRAASETAQPAPEAHVALGDWVRRTSFSRTSRGGVVRLEFGHGDLAGAELVVSLLGHAGVEAELTLPPQVNPEVKARLQKQLPSLVTVTEEAPAAGSGRASL